MKRPSMSAPIPFSAPTGSRPIAEGRKSPIAKRQVVIARLGSTANALAKQDRAPLSAKTRVRSSSTSRQQRRQRSIETLEQRQVFAAPTIGPIIDQNLLSGAPLQIALNATDADVGDVLTFSATSDNPNIVPVIRAQTNRSLVLTIEHVSSGSNDPAFTGTLTFQLFEDLTPVVTNRIIELVNQGFFTDILFHRVINNFVIQAGDPLSKTLPITDDGTGGSGVTFDDVFNADLQHTVSGLLSMAKSSDDTNDSQFFVTEGPQRNLDFNHSIFGMLTVGSSIREAISKVPTDSLLDATSGDPNGDNVNFATADAATKAFLDRNNDGVQDVFYEDKNQNGNYNDDTQDNDLNDDGVVPANRPLGSVKIVSATIFQDTRNEVLTLKAASTFTGSGTITVTVDDGNGGTAQQTFTVNATPDTNQNRPFLINEPLQINTPATGGGVAYQFESTDVDGGPLSYYAFLENAADSSKVIISINKTTGLFTATPVNGFSGVVNIFVVASPLSDADHAFIAQQVTNTLTLKQAYDFYSLFFDMQSVPVVVAPTAPTSIDMLASSDTGSSNTDNLTNLNNNGNSATLTFQVAGVTIGNLVQLYDGATLIGQVQAMGTIVNITTNATAVLSNGTHAITARQVLANQPIDAGNQNRTLDLSSSASAPLNITVDTTGPSFTSQPVTSLVQFSTYNYNANTDDEAGTGASYNLLNAPTGMTIDPSTGVVTWLPTQAQINEGTANVTIQATDIAGNASTQAYTITFVPNQAPTLDAISNQSVNEGTTFTYALVAQDPNLPGETLTYTLISGPANAVLNPTTGVVTFTTLETDGGTTKSLTVRVTDAGGLFTERSFDLVVNDTNSNPVVATIGTQTITESQQLVVQINASDADIPVDTLSYELLSGPTGTTIDANGVIRWTSNDSHGGTQQSISFRVNDNAGGSTTRQFFVNVTEQNQTPILTVQQSHTINELQTLTFTASATDADTPAQTLVYGLANAPAGMTLNVNTGVITWTPTEAQGPATYTVQIIVIDSLGGKDTKSVTISVAEVNQAPFLGTLNVLEAFSGSTLTAQIPGFDGDLPGQSLSYQLDAAPAGVSINATTGLLTWALPSGAAEGINTITVRLTDADGESVTQEYQIRVSVFVESVPPANSIPVSSLNLGNSFGLVSQWTSTVVPPTRDNRPVETETLQAAGTTLVNGQVAPVSVLGDNSANSVTLLLDGLNRIQAVNGIEIVEALKPVVEGDATGAINEQKSSSDSKSGEKPQPKNSGSPFDNTSAPVNDPLPGGNKQSHWQRRFDWREQLRAAALVETALTESFDLNWVNRAPQSPAMVDTQHGATPATATGGAAVPSNEEQQPEPQPLAASAVGIVAAGMVLRKRDSSPMSIPMVNDEVRRKRGPRRNWY